MAPSAAKLAPNPRAEIVAVFGSRTSPAFRPIPARPSRRRAVAPIHSVRWRAPPTDGVLHATIWAAFASDPFGLSLCRWRLADVRLTFRSPHHAVPFVASTGAEPNRRSGPLGNYWYLEADFRRPPPPITAVFGEAELLSPKEATFALRATIRRRRTGAALRITPREGSSPLQRMRGCPSSVAFLIEILLRTKREALDARIAEGIEHRRDHLVPEPGSGLETSAIDRLRARRSSPAGSVDHHQRGGRCRTVSSPPCRRPSPRAAVIPVPGGVAGASTRNRQ